MPHHPLGPESVDALEGRIFRSESSLIRYMNVLLVQGVTASVPARFEGVLHSCCDLFARLGSFLESKTGALDYPRSVSRVRHSAISA